MIRDGDRQHATEHERQSATSRAGGAGRRLRSSLGMLPTLFTLGNLLAGFAAIHYATKGQPAPFPGGWTSLEFAGALIFLGMILDAVDGSLARLTGSHSDIGVQLDTLADMVTFGIAPAFLTIQLVSRYLAADAFIIGPEADNVVGKLIWAIAAVYVSGTALRLARFNAESDSETDPEPGERADVGGKTFTGLPSPGAAGAVASLVILHQHILISTLGPDVPGALVRGAALGIPVVALLCGLAMVSSIPYVHFTNQFISAPRSRKYIIRFIVLLVLAIWWLPEILAIALTFYVLSGPVGVVRRRWRGRRSRSQ